MKKAGRFTLMFLAISCMLCGNVLARGGRAGAKRSAGRGRSMRRPAGRSSMRARPPSRPAQRSSLQRSGARIDSRRDIGVPRPGEVPSKGDLGKFLDIPKNQRPAAQVRPSARPDKPSQLASQEIGNRIRDQWQGRPVADRPFEPDWWADHQPNASQLAAWHHWNHHGWNQPHYWWRGATAAAVTGWIVQSWAEPAYYNHGDNIYYQEDMVYIDGEQYGTSAQYYEQAEKIATEIPLTNKEETTQVEWLPLGVFAVTQQDVAASDTLIQLAVSKEGIISGTYYNELIETSRPLQGKVDNATQRAVWTFADGKNTNVVMETGIYNLTEDQCKILVHFGPEKTRTYLMVRLPEPKDGAGAAAVE